ncbi:MAG: L-rhamnose/proton symporter RhaT [bacterium]
MALVLVAGAMQGGFPLPLKFTKAWEWENIWLASSALGLVIFPWLIAAWTIPDLTAVLGATSLRAVLVVFLFGAGWGIGGLLFGLGVHRVGLSLTFGIVIGLTSAFGSVLPLILFHPERLRELVGILVVVSVLATFVGLWFCALAGFHRERQLNDRKPNPKIRRFRRGSYRAGVVICIFSGLLSPLFNFALICGEPLIQAATNHGARQVDAPNLIWAVAMTGGLVPTMAYCGYLMKRNGTWSRFCLSGQSHDMLLALSMGALFAWGNSAYGMGAEHLGALGPILGWPVFMAFQVITGNVLAFATGEWRGSGRPAMWYMAVGNAALIVAVFMIAPAGG